MDLLAPVEMDIDDFNIGNIDNYDDVRGWTISFNKAALRMVSISSSKISVDYTTKIKYLNNVSDDEEIRELIDSSQLSYTEQREKEIQVSKATNYKNRIR